MKRVVLNMYRTLPGDRLNAGYPITFSVPQSWLEQWLAHTYEDHGKARLSLSLPRVWVLTRAGRSFVLSVGHRIMSRELDLS